MFNNSLGRVLARLFDTLEHAQVQAGIEAANTGGFSVPVIIFRQGNRTNMTGALPLSWLRSRLETRAARKGGSIREARNALNRPEVAEHSRAITNYLRENFRGRYILPPLTLNVQQPVNLYSVNYQSELRPGYLVIPPTAKLGITDGQHRRSAVIMAMDELSEDEQAEFGRDGIAVMITCETEAAQVHQDFADCSKTKPLPASMLAVFDMRNPANRLVIDLETRCELFRGRIDPSGTTLSKKSTFLFLANQVRQVVKELLAGSYALPDVEFERRARERLKSEEQYQEALGRFFEFLNEVTRSIPIWREITRLPADGLEANQIPGLRAQGWVCLTAAGLNLIGRFGHKLIVHASKDWRAYANALGSVDWRREAEIWQGNIVQSGRLMNQQAPVRRAFEAICKTVGWHEIANGLGVSQQDR